MKNFAIYFLFTLTVSVFSISLFSKVNASAAGDFLGRHGLEGPTVIVYDDYMSDNGTENSLEAQINEHVKLSNISDKNPLYIVIGKGIADNQDAFDKLIEYIGKTNAKNIVIKTEKGVKNIIGRFQDSFLSTKKIESFAIQGFKKLNYIAEFFLAKNRLTSFSTEGFETVEVIDEFFLEGNPLTSFSAKGLKKLKRIRANFLNDTELTSFSADGMKNLELIEEGFLNNNQKMRHVDLSALKKVTRITGTILDRNGADKIIVPKENADLFRQHIPDFLHDLIVVAGKG